MNEKIRVYAIAASRTENGIKEWYAGVKGSHDGLFNDSLQWDWYPEEMISNFNKLAQKIDNNININAQQTTSTTTSTKKTKKPAKNKRKDNSNSSGENIKHVQIMKGNLLFVVNTEQPKIESVSKLKRYHNDQNKKITRIVGCNNQDGVITWKVKFNDSDQVQKIPHSELILRNKDLFIEYCKEKLVEEKPK
ncbi:hypothetical protein TRFO_16591 [Tritrichomonas foetus]|uniref:Uncharacterized protein n=1 Tax=Tritrichomonas foetus TaxID=1144522 RepID=A0A1J4KPV7_9EUKA|nr:hypothetical protein TRFO_16591 [Tritrichomonas foetus]|eukprot:OHT13275.1 hypothetical protein TRFO_16591 [Tritrichomonas foetus]